MLSGLCDREMARAAPFGRDQWTKTIPNVTYEKRAGFLTTHTEEPRGPLHEGAAVLG